MKKMMTMVMALVIAAGMTACGNINETADTSAKLGNTAAVITSDEQTESTVQQTADIDTDVICGGWRIAKESPIEKNPEAKAALEKALEGMVGAEYEPLAVLGTQVVAGTNYCILCRVTAVYPDAQPTMQLVYVYEALDGKAEITGFKELIGETLDGGFAANAGDTSLEKNADVKTAFDKSMECVTGMSFEPTAYLGSQVVAGTNYLVLCKGTATVPDAKPVPVLVTIYADLNGNAELCNTEDITLGETDKVTEE